MNVPIWIFCILLTRGRVFSTLFAPRYISPTVTMDSNSPSTLEVTFFHGFGVLPVKAEVQAQAIGLKTYTGLVYPGVGSSHNDDDLGQKRGGVLYFYNDTHVVLYGASNAEGTGAGIIFTGQNSYTREQQEFSTVASVRVRVWHPGDFPVPVFQSEWLFMSAGSNGTTFKEVPHGLGSEPDHVVVHVRGNDGGFHGLVGEAQGSSLSREHYSSGLSSSWGGIIFGYNDAIVRILAPSTNESDVSIMCAKDGWGNRRSDASYSGHVRVTAWYLGNPKFIATHAHYSKEWVRDDPRDHFINVPQINKDMDLITVQAKSKSGLNLGFSFYAGGAAMVDNVNTWVGGFVYAYTDIVIQTWHQVDWCIIFVPHYFGGDRVPECTRQADVIVRVWNGTRHSTTYVPTSASSIAPNASASTGFTNATSHTTLSTYGVTYATTAGVVSTQAPTAGVVSSQAPTTGVVSSQTTTGGDVSLRATTTGVISSQATTAGVVSSQTTTVGVVSPQATTVVAVSSQATTTGVITSQTTTVGVVSSQATTVGVISLQATTGEAASLQATTAGDVSLRATTTGETSAQATTSGVVSSQATTGEDVSSPSSTAGDVSPRATNTVVISSQPTTTGVVSPQETTGGDISSEAMTVGDVSSPTMTAGEISTSATTARVVSLQATTGEDVSSQASTAGDVFSQLTTAGFLSSQASTTRDVSSQSATMGNVSPQTATSGDISSQATTAGVVSSQATTGEDTSSQASTAGDVSSRVTQTGVVSSRATTAGDISTQATIPGDVSSQATTRGTMSSQVTTPGVVSSLATTSGDVSSDASTVGNVSSQATTSGDVSSRATTSGMISLQVTTAGDVSSEQSTAGLVTSQATNAGYVSSEELTSGYVSSEATTAGDVSSQHATRTEIFLQSTTPGGISPQAETATAVSSQITTDAGVSSKATVTRGISTEETSISKVILQLTTSHVASSSFGDALASSVAINYTTTPSTFTISIPMTTSGSCVCRSACNKLFILPDNMTLTDFVNSLLMEMTVLKNETSKHRRSLVSTEDKRRSSQMIGYTGIIVISCTFGMILLLDLSILWQKLAMTSSRTTSSTKHPLC